MTENKPMSDLWEVRKNTAGRVTVGPVSSAGNIAPFICDEETARRVVACVNACAGIKSEILEKGARHDWGDLMMGLEKQRDELLKSLDQMVVAFEHQDGSELYRAAALLKAMELIGRS